MKKTLKEKKLVNMTMWKKNKSKRLKRQQQQERKTKKTTQLMILLINKLMSWKHKTKSMTESPTITYWLIIK